MPEQPDATIVHGDYRLGNTMFADEPPARLIAIFDWELATIGDPLADVGYLTATWSEPNRDERKDTMFDHLTVTHGEGFPTRDELVARYEEQSGRSVDRPALVPGARPLEGRGLHGGQLQGVAGRATTTTRTSSSSTTACRSSPRPRTRSRSCRPRR